MSKKLMRCARKAKKILTEFDLKNNRRLRIYVLFWGERQYAKNLGYYGNTVYKPVLVGADGFEKNIYKHHKGLPTLDELKRFYAEWKGNLAYPVEAKRLKEVAGTLYELAEISTCFEKRQTHVIYQLLRMTKGGPTFRILKPSDANDLDAEIVPVVVVSFKGYKSYERLSPYFMGTKLIKALEILHGYNKQMTKVLNVLRQELAEFAGPEGPSINLNVIADHMNNEMKKIFEKELP